jgi:enhancer of polycomb-like protein
MTRAGAAARFRQRKLSTKQSLQILREDQIEKVDDDAAQRNVPKVETGVEKGEEIVSRKFCCLCPVVRDPARTRVT